MYRTAPRGLRRQRCRALPARLKAGRALEAAFRADKCKCDGGLSALHLISAGFKTRLPSSAPRYVAPFSARRSTLSPY